jgi:branched-chain amino acid transport system substrate-binding protein
MRRPIALSARRFCLIRRSGSVLTRCGAEAAAVLLFPAWHRGKRCCGPQARASRRRWEATVDRIGRSGFLGRRQVLALGTCAAGALAIPAVSAIAAAENRPPLGTWPAGVEGDSIFVGITVPLTGPYSADGKDEQLGYELAIAELNAGSDVARKWGVKGKGVLGKQIRYQVADSETKPNVAVQAQTQFIHSQKAIMIAGCVSSATAIALEELAQREKVLNMVGGSSSNDTTGKNCRRYGFRSQCSAYMACKALAPVLAQKLGHGKKAAYLVPDYTYGHSIYASFTELTRPAGWTIATQQVVPLGTTDFSSALLNIANSGADVFVNFTFGADAVASNRQAQQFGVLRKMRLVVPNISAFQAKELGADLMQGVYGTMDFYWGLEDRFPLARDFVQAFLQRFKYYPRWLAHIAYSQTLVWAAAVERAGTFYPVDVIKSLEASKSNPFDSALGKIWYRAEDHQEVRPVPVVVGKAPAAMRNPEDFYDVVELVPGEQVMPPIGMFGCHLGSYT